MKDNIWKFEGRRIMEIPLLDLQDVTYRANGRKILDRVSWTVRPGENWAIVGPNGAGKSTLLRIICGFLWPNSGGEVFRNGESYPDLGALRRSIGWVASSLSQDIPRGEKVVDTVLSGKYAQIGFWGLPDQEPDAPAVAAARNCLAQLGCLHLAERQFGTLSQGEQQIVLVCRALMAQPYLLILDEPCAGMDPGIRETFLSALSLLAEKGRPALVYVTHHVEEIIPAFNRALVLKEGRIMASGATEDIFRDELFNRLYGVSVQLLKRSGRYWPVSL